MPQLEITERVLVLRTIPTLRTLPSNALAQLAATLRNVAFRKGEVLLREDEPPRSFFLLTSGTVTMRRRDKRIGTVRGPGAVGFMSFLARNAGGTAAVAESYVEALEVQGDAMEEIFEDHLPVLLGTMRFIADRLITENKISSPPPYVPPADSFDQIIGDRLLGIVERIFLLRRMRVFSAANVNSLATLARKMTEVREPGGVTLWRANDRADHSYFVVKGTLSLTWNEGATVQKLGPGYVVGGAESIALLPRWNDLVTDEPVVLLRGTREGLIDLFEDDHELALNFQSMLATLVVTMWDRKAEEGIASVGAAESNPLLPGFTPAPPP